MTKRQQKPVTPSSTGGQSITPGSTPQPQQLPASPATSVPASSTTNPGVRQLSDNERKDYVAAVSEEYNHVTDSIGKFASLQYQLVGLAYTLIGAIITVLLATFSKDATPATLTTVKFLILFFPPIFCVTTLIQLYLHKQIKLYGRYTYQHLRPQMNRTIFNDSPKDTQDKWTTDDDQWVWGWEKFYRSKQDLGFKLFGAMILGLPIVPGFIVMIFFVVIPAVSTPTSPSATAPATQSATQAATSSATQAATSSATQAATSSATQAATQPSTSTSSANANTNPAPANGIENLLFWFAVADGVALIVVLGLIGYEGVIVEQGMQDKTAP